MNNYSPEDITKEYIRGLPLLAFEGKIHVIETEEQSDRALFELKKYDILGFDTEKKPTFLKGEYNPTAMVQLSTIDDAYLFRLNKIGYHEPLFDLMADEGIVKYGISIDDDLKELERLRKFTPKGFTDLNTIAKEIGTGHIGVKKLAAIFLEKRISKGQQTSNWENTILTTHQQRYAATDAWICVRIYNELIEKGLWS